jgi:hypothetical protein
MSKRIAIGLATGLVFVAAAVIAVWFQPQKLWIDKKVDEAAPPSVTPTTTEQPMSPAEARPTTAVKRGSFRPLDHQASGSAILVSAADSTSIVRLEDLDVENGPDLYVYLSSAEASNTNDGVFDDDFVSLGRLKGNQGNQNYEVPSATDVQRYRSVVIWCKRFSTGFAVAPLT